jgi:hypothetical protein
MEDFDAREREVLARLKKFVLEELRLSVGNPDYREAGFYHPQWRVSGSSCSYSLPNGGPVIAVIDRADGVAEFSTYLAELAAKGD